MYDMSEVSSDEDGALNLKEFVYFNIYENIKVSGENDCKHCFKETKGYIDDFFDYLDCNHDGFVSAENIYHGM